MKPYTRAIDASVLLYKFLPQFLITVFNFLVTCMRLYKPLCWSVGWSVGPSVGRCSQCTRLMAIGLVWILSNSLIFLWPIQMIEIRRSGSDSILAVKNRIGFVHKRKCKRSWFNSKVLHLGWQGHKFIPLQFLCFYTLKLNKWDKLAVKAGKKNW